MVKDLTGPHVSRKEEVVKDLHKVFHKHVPCLEVPEDAAEVGEHLRPEQVDVLLVFISECDKELCVVNIRSFHYIGEQQRIVP